ncbi:hypothetical protein [Thermosporothrix hazakensis]|uniref:Uncharacterized protein n=1 Tax=Thermosporothrix sp. COM3 TaxID=2490863 RepID=A0A455SJS9_9CHLR|nr:hypothetical protein [Thermosporothrix hazakensis]BBH87209.1 hypothetical protein KTC_19600 [Thermosporothrix sp. COM3]GCE50598.1 hypothetical protein KTH_54670 [Thermosporothrix hazakensis]
MLRNGFIRTTDSSVGDEYKSPIYQSMHAFKSSIGNLDKLAHLVGTNCGTHIHVECQPELKVSIQRDYGVVWGPLFDHLLEYPLETFLFWGRGFCSYATPGGTDSHYMAINPWTRHQTVEFRLPCFRSKEQFVPVVQFARSCVSLLTQRGMDDFSGIRPEIGQEILSLYQRYIPGDQRWFDALPEDEQTCLLLHNKLSRIIDDEQMSRQRRIRRNHV